MKEFNVLTKEGFQKLVDIVFEKINSDPSSIEVDTRTSIEELKFPHSLSESLSLIIITILFNQHYPDKNMLPGPEYEGVNEKNPHKQDGLIFGEKKTIMLGLKQHLLLVKIRRN